jgi:hypothetical protein
MSHNLISQENFDEFNAKSGPIIFTSYETGKELDLDKMFNHLGPERTFALAEKLKKIIFDDYNQAMNESLNKEL